MKNTWPLDEKHTLLWVIVIGCLLIVLIEVITYHMQKNERYEQHDFYKPLNKEDKGNI